jgi:DNA gyrase inhibitor GyrI
MRADTVVREDVPVMYAAADGDWRSIPDAARTAFTILEKAVPAKGRKIFGYWHPPAMQYRACYGLRDADDPADVGLSAGIVPGGRYRRTRLKGAGVFAQIPDAFVFLEGMGGLSDDGRPWLEVYRRHDEVDVLVPVVAA